MPIYESERAKATPQGIPRLGILILDTRFPRIVGDMGNPETWPFPTLFYKVEGATPLRVAGDKAVGLLQAFVDGGHALARAGAAGITTTCGFLSILQQELVDRLPVPVAASVLLQVPMVQAFLPAGKHVGILTYSKEFLTAEHLERAGVNPETPVEGVPKDGAFFDVITHGAEVFDFDLLQNEVIEAGRRLIQNHPDVGAVVLECANMPPYSAALRRELGLPVFDGVGFIRNFYKSLAREPAVGPNLGARADKT